MSYDFKLEFEKTSKQKLLYILNSKQQINNSLFSPSENYHMEIDIESENLILFHIPDEFMNKEDVDHQKYLDIINELATSLEGKAYDLQQDLYLIDPTYIPPKNRIVNTLFSNSLYNKFHVDDGKIIISADENKSTIIIDLSSYTIKKGTNETYKERVHLPFTILKRFVSDDSKYVAVRNWNKKLVRVFQNSESLNAKKDSEVWDSPNIFQMEKCGQVQNIVFSSDGTLFTSAYKSNIVKLWDIKTKKVIKEFKTYSRSIYGLHKIGKDLLFTLSNNGVTFFELDSSKILLHLYPALDSWICFDTNGNYKGEIRTDVAYELDYKDNKYSESHCFIPKVGFAAIRPSTKWKLFKLKRFSNTKHTPDLIKESLSPFLK